MNINYDAIRDNFIASNSKIPTTTKNYEHGRNVFLSNKIRPPDCTIFKKNYVLNKFT